MCGHSTQGDIFHTCGVRGWEGEGAEGRCSPHPTSPADPAGAGRGSCSSSCWAAWGSRAPPPASLSLLMGFPFPVLGVTFVSWAGPQALGGFSRGNAHNSCPSQIWERLGLRLSADTGSLTLLFACVLRSMLFSCELAE